MIFPLLLVGGCTRHSDDPNVPLVARVAELERRLAALEEHVKSVKVNVRPDRITALDVLLDVQGFPTLGVNDQAPVMIEFSDFQCPYCRAFASGTFGEVKAQFVDTGRLRYVFVNMPLERIHPRALNAAKTAHCAWKQGKFWEVRDSFFREPALTDPVAARTLVADLGVDPTTFSRCMDAEAEPQIRASMSLGERLGVVATPTFIFGRTQSDGRIRAFRRIRGIVDVATTEDAIIARN